MKYDNIKERMFTSTIEIKGKHADYMDGLTSVINTNLNKGIFERNLDIYLIAPLVGVIYNRKSPLDEGSNLKKISVEQLNYNNFQLKHLYQTVTMLNKNLSLEEKVNASFLYEKDREKRMPYETDFDAYVRGGIEVLYEKLLDGVKPENYLDKLFDFFEEINNLYLLDFDYDSIMRLMV